MQSPPNPYAPPIAQDVPAESGPNAEHEAIRRAHLSSETNIKSIGSLAILGAVLQLLGSLALMTTAPVEAVIRIVVVVGVGASGLWLRDLKPLGRTVYSALLALGVLSTLVSVAVATHAHEAMPVAAFTVVIGGLFLWVLWNSKARVVFSEHYRQVVIPATPYVKYKTSKVAIAVLVLLLLGFVAAIVAAIL
jgi:hypothetical protein